MSNTNPSVNVGDSLVSQLASSVLRHALTAAAGALVTAGALQTDQQSQFVAIASGGVLWGVGQLWSWVQKIRAAKGK